MEITELVNIAYAMFTKVMTNKLKLEDGVNVSWKALLTAAYEKHDCYVKLQKLLNTQKDELINEWNDLSGYELQTAMRNKISSILLESGYEKDEVGVLQDVFEKHLLQEVKFKNHQLYLELVEQKFFDLGEEHHAEVVSYLKDIKRITEQKFRYTYTIDQWEQKFSESNKFELTLDFFDFGEEKIEKQLIKDLSNNKAIYLCAPSRPEGIGFILRLLKENNYEKVLVVGNEEEWQIITEQVVGYILMPIFETEDFLSSKNNKMIFVYSQAEYCDDDIFKKTIVLPKRLSRNFYEKLSEKITDNDELNRIIAFANNDFYALMRKIGTSKRVAPQWENFHDKQIFFPAFLLSKWKPNNVNNTFDDYKILEELAECEYDKYLYHLRNANGVHERFFREHKSSFSWLCEVIDPFNAWQVLTPLLTCKIINQFRELFERVMLDQRAIDCVNMKYQYDNGLYSLALKNGMLLTLVIMSTSRAEKITSSGIDYQEFAFGLISSVLDKINTPNKWKYISQFLPIMVEIAPDIVIEKIYNECNNEKPEFLTIFKDTQNNFDEKAFYYNVHSALQKAMFINEGILNKSIKIVELIVAKLTEGRVKQTFESMLTDFYCGWINEFCIDKNFKIQLLKNFVETYPNVAWNILKNITPFDVMGGTYSPFTKPIYQNFDYHRNEEVRVTNSEVVETYKQYFNLAIQCANDDLKKWAKFFERCSFINYGIKEEVYDRVKKLLQSNIKDDKKYIFSKAVRKYIYNSKYLPGYTTHSETIVNDVKENIFELIRYEDKVYCYLYAFENYWEVEDFEHVENIDKETYESRNKNIEELREKILRDNIISQEFDLMHLLELTSDQWSLGITIAKVVYDNKFDKTFIEKCYKMDKKEVLGGYIGVVLGIQGLDKFLEAIAFNFGDEKLLKLRTFLLQHINIDTAFFEYLEGQTEEIKNKYWCSLNAFLKIDDKKLLEKIIDYLLQYNNFNQIITLIDYNDIPPRKALKILEAIDRFNVVVPEDKIKKLFQFVYKGDDFSTEEIVRIVVCERNHVKIISAAFQPKYLLNRLKIDAGYSAELIKMVYKGEADASNITPTIEQKNQANLAFNVLFYVKYCPCEENGKIDLNELKTWCKEFLDKTATDDRKTIGEIYLGKFLAHSPNEQEGCWPCYAVCEVIEEIYNKEIGDAFVIEVLNSRSVYSMNGGAGEVELAVQYENFAKALPLKYVRAKEILFAIAKEYWHQAEDERERGAYV